MSGLVKAKEYDWKDSNLALFGSDTEKDVKKSSAETEQAWKNAGSKPGLQIWRIVKFKVTKWPKEEYGKFYDGDSYIILNTYKEEDSDTLLYDVHFWIGKHSTQDEYGTAAYKTVELDTFLDDRPVQHREVQGHESKMFKSYFKEITILRGGAESGFRKVEPTKYEPRLLHFHGDRNLVHVKEIPRRRELLDSTDVFILDLGLQVLQWNGRDSNKDERFKAAAYINGIKNDRGKCTSETYDEASPHCGRFYNRFDAIEEPVDATQTADNSEMKPYQQDRAKQLFRLSDATGELTFQLEKEQDISASDLDPEDVFILDTRDEVFVWIGNGTTDNERKNAMSYAHVNSLGRDSPIIEIEIQRGSFQMKHQKELSVWSSIESLKYVSFKHYLMKTDHPLLPVTCVGETKMTRAFQVALTA